MTLSANIDVPTFEGSISIEIKAGTSLVFIGANGAGKTRLGVYLDNRLSMEGLEVHRLAAHRSLKLNPNVMPTSYQVATNRLFYGYETGTYTYKAGHRFSGKPETDLLNDFDHVLSALYADNNDVSIAYRESCLTSTGPLPRPPLAKLDKLKSIWENVLPHRELVVLAGNIKTKTSEGQEYSASDMSDGERVVFYVIAQTLLAKPDTLLIFDEPELHINKAILAKLWDEIESARPDCGFLYITHDVEFAATRHAATKYSLRKYQKEPSEAWDIEILPESGEIPDDVVALIIGSRRPVLFVEGNGGSLDSSLYRRVYQDFTVIAVGSCEQVIQTVASFAARPELHRVGCAGLIDSDGRSSEEVAYLEARGVYCLPVSEVENLLLLPSVFSALAQTLRFPTREIETKLAALRTFVATEARAHLDEICLRASKRRIDSAMKKIGLTSQSVEALQADFGAAAAGIDPGSIFVEVRSQLEAAIDAQEYEKVLYHYDNKGLLAEAARQLGYQQRPLEEFIGRALRSDESSVFHTALRASLPTITPRP